MKRTHQDTGRNERLAWVDAALRICGFASLLLYGGALVAAESAPAERIFRAPQYRRGNTNLRVETPIERARWIRHPDQDKLPAGTPAAWRFERTFDWDGTPFEIDVSADERFVLLLDGAEIARGPNRGTPDNWTYQSYRLRPAKGAHTLAAVVWQAGAYAPNAQLSFEGGFILKASGAADKLLSTGTADWQVGRLSGPRHAYESAVGGPVTVTGTGLETARPSAFVSAVPEYAKPYRASAYGSLRRGWLLYPSELPDQLATRRELFGALTVPARTKKTILRDLGDYYCAYPELRCAGGKGAKITWGWAESLFVTGQKFKKGNRNESAGKEFRGITDTFVADGRGDAVFTIPWWRAGRWIKIEIEAADEPLEVKSAAIVESRYPLADEGAFACEDPTWPSVAAMCLRGMQMCDHEMLMDCPYYEQQMYGGDTRVQLNVLRTLSKDDRMIRRAIELFELARRDDGLVPMNWPSRARQSSATFTMCHLLMYGDYVRWHRNVEWLRARLPGLRHGLSALAGYTDADGLLADIPGWRFIDWVPAWNDYGNAPGDGKAPGAIENLFWTMTLRSAAEVERALGDKRMADYWSEKADRVVEAIRAKFWDEAKGLMADEVTHTSFSEHTQALALLAADLPQPDAMRVLAALEDWTGKARCSVYFRFYLFEAFYKYGRGDLYQKHLDLWRGYVKDGLKTPLESPSLDGVEDARSDCHAWGSHPIYFMRTAVAGIRPDAAGFRRVRVAPVPGSLKTVKATVPHPDGEISVDFAFEGGSVRGRIVTPVPGVFVWRGVETPLTVGANEIVRTAADAKAPTAAVRDPAKVWNLTELFKTPETRKWQNDAHLETRAILLKSEPWKGKATWVFAHYGIPEHASKEHPVPAIVLAHGGLGTAYPSWVATWVRRGYAAICVDTCGSFPIRTADGKWLKNPEGGPTGWGRLDLIDEPEREQWMHHAVAAVVRSHSFLRSLPEVDADSIGITGISWGGILTCTCAGVDNRFKYAIPVYGCGYNCTPVWGIMARGAHADKPAASAKWFKLWDPAVYLPHAKCPFLWVDGTNDAHFRLDDVRRSAELTQGTNAYATITRMIHSHGFYGENQPEIFAFADHYASGKPDVVRFTAAGTENGVFTATFDRNGHNVVRAELLYTADGEDVKWDNRYWRTQVIEKFDQQTGKVSVAVSADAKMYYVNLIDYTGLVSSTPVQIAK